MKQRAKQRGSIFYSASKAALSTVKASSDGLLAFFPTNGRLWSVEWAAEWDMVYYMPPPLLTLYLLVLTRPSHNKKAFSADKLVVFQAVNWQYIVGLKVYYALQQLCTNCTRIPLSKLLWFMLLGSCSCNIDCFCVLWQWQRSFIWKKWKLAIVNSWPKSDQLWHYKQMEQAISW